MKSSELKHRNVVHIYWNVFERLLFELNLFHIFFAYDVGVDNHSPWDNLNPSSLFLLCGSLERLYEKTHPTDSEIKLFFHKVQQYTPIVKYKCVNSNKWKMNTFVNANADINNDYYFVSRILHNQLLDSDTNHSVHDDDEHKSHTHDHNHDHIMNHNNFNNDDSKQNTNEKEKISDNFLYYQIFLKLIDNNNNNTNNTYNKTMLIKSDVVKDTFNVDTNEELSRNMMTPSLYLNSGHILGARKWLPESDIYGTVMIKCHNTILVSKNSFITASGAGYTSHYGKGHGNYYKEPHPNGKGNKYYSGGGYGCNGKDSHPSKSLGGRKYGDKRLSKVLHFGSPSGGRERGGGIIELIANTVLNYGHITCNGDSGSQFGGGSGGSIKIVCKTFINHGKITAHGGEGGMFERKFSDNNAALRVGGTGGYGRIAIYCEKYINIGTISPKPYLNLESFVYSDDILFTPLAVAKDNLYEL